MLAHATSARISWCSIPKPRPEASVRLFCFPYAGSGSNVFYAWPSKLPECVEVCLVHLPGRERRLNEKPYDRLSELVRDLERPLLGFIDRPIAFFGHSMGGLIAFETARHLNSAFGVEPAHLFVSGCAAPHRAQWLPPIQTLPQEQFLSGLRNLVGNAPLSMGEGQIMDVMLSTLRADFALCQTYEYTTTRLLTSGISVLGGTSDPSLNREQLELWRDETAGRFALYMFNGGHFFIRTEEEAVLKTLSSELEVLADSLN